MVAQQQLQQQQLYTLATSKQSACYGLTIIEPFAM
jgi:hypothetical protein